jgi:hypothetical protein
MSRYNHIVSILFVLLFFGKNISQNVSLKDFELKDQFDQTYTHEDFLGQICILVGSDRKGSQYNERWSIAIHDSLSVHGLQDSVKFLALANLKGVPRLLRGFVKGKFPKEDSHPILLDWKGSFAEEYQFLPYVSNIILFSKSGHLVCRMEVLELNTIKLNDFLAEIFVLFEL